MHYSLIQGGIVYKQFCNQLLTPGVNKRSYFTTWKGFVNVLFEYIVQTPAKGVYRVVENRAFACEL